MAVSPFSRGTTLSVRTIMISAGLGIQGRRVFVQIRKLQRRHGGHQQRHGLPLAAGESAHDIQLILQAQAQTGQLLMVAR